MIRESLIINFIYTLFVGVKHKVRESFVYSIYIKICGFFNKLLEESCILNFLKKNPDDPKKASTSFIVNFKKKYIGRCAAYFRFGKSAFARGIRQSVIINLLNRNTILMLLYLLIFGIPFFPTVILVALSFLCVFIYVLNILIGKISFKVPSLLGIFMLLFCLAYLYSTLTSYNMPNSIYVFFVFISLFSTFFIAKECINSEKKLDGIIITFLLSAVLVALYGIYQYKTGVVMDSAWVDKEAFGNITVRAFGTFGNPNVMGEYMIVAASVCAGMLWKAKTPLKKTVFLISFLILCLGLVVTNSRGAMLGLILAAGIFVLLSEKRLIILGVLLLMATPIILPDELWKRIASSVAMNDSSSLYRISIYKASFEILKDYWFTGIGVDAFNLIYPIYSYAAAVAYHSHNLFLQEFIELGIIGFSLLICSLLLFFQKLYFGIRNSVREYKYILGAIFGGFAGILLQGMVDHLWFNYKIVLLFFGIMGIGIACVKIGVKENNEENKSYSSSY